MRSLTVCVAASPVDHDRINVCRVLRVCGMTALSTADVDAPTLLTTLPKCQACVLLHACDEEAAIAAGWCAGHGLPLASLRLDGLPVPDKLMAFSSAQFVSLSSVIPWLNRMRS